MSQITAEEVKRTADLAHLNIENIDKTVEKLSNIIALAENLQRINTDSVEPTIHANQLQNVFREDILEDGGYPREAMLSNAKNRAGCYVVPKTFDGGVE